LYYIVLFSRVTAVKHLSDIVRVAAGNIAESLNDQRMMRPVDRRCYRVPGQLSLDLSSTPAAISQDLPPGLQQLLGKNPLLLSV